MTLTCTGIAFGVPEGDQLGSPWVQLLCVQCGLVCCPPVEPAYDVGTGEPDTVFKSVLLSSGIRVRLGRRGRREWERACGARPTSQSGCSRLWARSFPLARFADGLNMDVKCRNSDQDSNREVCEGLRDSLTPWGSLPRGAGLADIQAVPTVLAVGHLRRPWAWPEPRRTL